MDQHVVHTCCAHNCGGRAVLQCTVRDGRLVRVEPGIHPDARYTAACVRCLSLPGWVYSEDRLKYPMKRVGERGEGRFERVAWDEALDIVAERLRSIGATHGADSVAFARSSGTSAMGNYATLQALLGASQLFGSVDMAVHMGLNSTFGFKGLFDQGTNEWTDRPNARSIIVWGHNPAETAMTVFRWLLNARDSGSRLVVIDPRYSATAMHADWWVAPHPGTDTALALGMLHVIIADGLVDEAFALAHSCAPLLVRTDTGRYLREAELHAAGAERFVVWDGGRDAPVADGESTALVLDGEYTAAGIPVKTAYRLLREMLAGYAPDRTAEITGVPAADIRDLARIYATETPATIAFGYGVDRYLHGDIVTRAGAALAVLTGNIGRPGASVGVASHGLGHRQATLDRGPVPQRRATPSIPNIDVGQRELGLRALFNAGDYLNQRIADQNRAIEWIKALEFVVVVDHFWQTTARWADVVLPASTFLESDSDLVDVVTWGNSVILKRKVLDPLWDSRPDREIERALAERLGLGEHYSVTAEETIRRRIEDSEDPAVRGITLEGLIEAGGSLRLNVPESSNVQYADLRFGTPSGRAEFYIEDLAPLGEALPVYKGDHEAARGHPLARRFPLVLTQTHARQRAHSTFFNNSWLLDIWPEPVLELNPDDAAARGIDGGDAVEAYNDRGRVAVNAVLNPDYPPGMCNITEGWKQDQFREGHLQQLVNGRINPAQELLWNHANLPFSDTRVEVRKQARAGGDK